MEHQIYAEEIPSDFSSVASEEADFSVLSHFPAVKDRIVYQLINRKLNEAFLSEAPHIPYLDLAIIFCCLLSVGEGGIMSFAVRDAHLFSWDVSVKELFYYAKSNTPRLLPYELLSFSADVPMQVLTNRLRLRGASCVLYQGLLEEMASRLGGDLLILPSSIHEVILLPLSEAHLPADREAYDEMVQSVNRAVVLPEEVLSDHAYYYSVKEGRMIC